MTRLRTGLVGVAYAAFVAYLSFVPFLYEPLPFDQALAEFARIRYLDLGAGSRADWVANILMYVPLGWLIAAWIVPRPRGRFDLLAILPALAAGSVWAVAVEFGQVFFPNRTVSLNDIIAEVVGSLLGASLWSAFAARSRDWWRTLLRGGTATANAALGGYVLAYLVLSFSPFDFVASAKEIADKAAASLHGWWLAPVSCGPTPCSLKLVAELLAIVPFGWWLAMRRRSPGSSVVAAALAGFGIGVLIEAAQFLLVSGTSQGASVLARTFGTATGAWLYLRRDRIRSFDWSRYGRPIVLLALPAYLGAVAYVGGWFSGQRLGLRAGLDGLAQVQWLPFYYQYFTTEQALIRSTLVHIALYAPVGVAVWLWRRGAAGNAAGAAALLAAGLAFVAETGKLFIAGKHPDYTDLLIAALAAWVTFTVLRWASSAPRSGAVEADLPAQAAAQVGEPAAPAGASAGASASRAAGIALLLLAGYSVVRFPLWQLPLAIGLAGYALLLWRYPTLYLLALPIALPLLDLAPFSGRFYWDEFDFLLAVTLGARLLKGLPAGSNPMPLPRAALGVLAFSVIVSAAIALLPPAPLDANAFSSYLSSYNALRIAKGYLWGAALIWLIRRDAGARGEAFAQVGRGLGLGLLAAVIGVFWERLQFVGLGDFGAYFRAAGLVSATHVGGAYLEAILVVLTPFALAQAVCSKRAAWSSCWYAVAAVGAIAVLMTLSRAAFAAWLAVVVVFYAVWIVKSRGPAAASGTSRGRWAAGAVAGALIAVALLGAQSTYLRERLTLSGTDLDLRTSHWRDTVELIRADPLHLAFGMGLGSFPREFYLANATAQKLPAYQLGRNGNSETNFLALIGGGGMYIDQRIDAEPGAELRLRGQIRSPHVGAKLAVGICEKSFLNSTNCDWTEITAGPQWQGFEVRLTAPRRPATGLGPATPVALTLSKQAFGPRVEVARLSLVSDGELLNNGSFARGLDRWLMTSDLHLAWRAHSTPVQVAFEQGAAGIVAWLLLGVSMIALVASRGASAASAASFAAAAVGFVAVGFFDSLLDSPRLVVLAALIVAVGLGAGFGGEDRQKPRATS